MKHKEGGISMAKRVYNDARKRANEKYNEKAYWRYNVALRKELEQLVRDKASAEGKSLNGYLADLIKADLGIENEIEKESN